jgi:hypothetical protein
MQSVVEDDSSPRASPAPGMKQDLQPVKMGLDAAPAAGPHDGMGGEREEGGDASTGMVEDSEFYPQVQYTAQGETENTHASTHTHTHAHAHTHTHTHTHSHRILPTHYVCSIRYMYIRVPPKTKSHTP